MIKILNGILIRGRAFTIVVFVGLATLSMIWFYPLAIMAELLTKSDLEPWVDLIKNVWIWYGGAAIAAFGAANVTERITGHGMKPTTENDK